MPHPFDLLMELPARQVRLDCAALHLARDQYPTVSVTKYLRLLDELADAVAAQRAGVGAISRYDAIRRVLVDERGFRGNFANYYAPENCYLNRVLDTRLGIPITLSTIWVEIGRRLKWPVRGVGLPGHFIVRFDDPERFVLADPFHDGRSLTVADCRRLVEERFGGDLAFRRSFLKPVGSREILVRLLQNLRNVYLSSNDLTRAATVLQRMAALEPHNGRHLQDLAAVCCRRGDLRAALAHLALYLHRSPNAHDSAQVRSSLRQLRAAVAALN